MKSVIVVDNFYKDPLAKREEALACRYRGDGAYPGKNSVRRFYSDDAMKKIAVILGTPIQWDTFKSGGHYRISTAKDTLQLDIHTDSVVSGIPFPQWTGVCYLNLPQDCHGGTSFWCHRKTGLKRYPTPEEYRSVSRIAKIPATPAAIRNYFLREGLDRSHWTEVKRVPMVFNRLVLLQSNLFHSPTSIFGTTRKACRLIQVLAFNEADYLIKKVMQWKKN